MFKFLIKILRNVLAIGFLIPTAVNADDATATATQFEISNEALTTIAQAGNQAEVIQIGDFNETMITQTGSGNAAVVTQGDILDGPCFACIVSIQSDGNDNSVELLQIGEGNEFYVTQEDNGNSGLGEQIGQINTATLIQNNGDNFATVIQRGDGFGITVTQQGGEFIVIIQE